MKDTKTGKILSQVVTPVDKEQEVIDRFNAEKQKLDNKDDIQVITLQRV
jgi:hypothetical protein